MKKRLVYSLVLLVAGLAVRLPVAAEDLSAPRPPQSRVARETALPEATALAAGKILMDGNRESRFDRACTTMTLSCGSTVESTLTADDCVFEDGTFVDFWEFQGTAGETVTIDMMSSAFDTYLLLYDPLPERVASDDDGGDGTDSRIVFPLGETGTWAIAANSVFDGDVGGYRLSLDCAVSAPVVPTAPSDLTATAISTTVVALAWQDNSDDEDEFLVESRASGGAFQVIDLLPSDSTGVEVSDLSQALAYDFRVRARNTDGDSDYSNIATAFRGPCIASDTVLCLNGSRFQVEVRWTNFAGESGPGRDVGFGSDDSGLLWFFNADNWEMLLKVLDGCALNDHYWVFSAATTNVEYTLEVTDTATGLVEEYFNPLGNDAPAITDTTAFATCP